MKKNLLKKAISVLLGTAMLLTYAPVPGTSVLAAGNVPERMELAASNDLLELYFDEKAVDFAVRVKATGDVWFSNPQWADEDPKANDYYKGLLKSQFSIRYYNEKVQASEMDSYSDAVAEEQYSVEYVENGVKVIYNLGNVADKYVLPQIISAERYEYYTSMMESSAARSTGRSYIYLDPADMKEDVYQTYLETYPTLAEYPLYVLIEGAPDYKKEELTEYFLAVGYTVEEMEADNEKNGYNSVNEKPWFNIEVTYFLEGDSLVAELDPNRVEYDTEKYYLVDIDLLRYFGAGGAEDEGYLFVPDGSGALIRFNNGKSSASSYIGYVYGEDKTNQVNMTKKSEIDQDVTVRMPVFGLKNGDAAFFAIVEGGAANADINAGVGGLTDSSNYVYAGFTYLSYGTISLGDIVGANSFQMYSQPLFPETFRVRYSFLHGDEADYSGMASYYQDYLVEKGVFNERVEGDVTPLYAEFVGAIEKWDSILGIKCKVTQELTTYEQAAAAVKELMESGVEGIKVEYSGWSTGGLHGGAPGSVKALGHLDASNMKLADFLQEMSGSGIPVFHTAELQYVYKDTIFDGYRAESQAPRYYDKTQVKLYEYFIPNGIKDKETATGMISPYFVEAMADTFLKRTEKYSLSGISIGNLANDLFSDFYDKRYVNRMMAEANNSAAMEKLAASCDGNLLGSNANVYAWAYLSDIKDVPLDSNRTLLIDEVVPFYEIVLHGYREYAGKPVNLSGDVNTMILKSIESGAGLSFEWICGDNSLLKNTDFDTLYSVNFDDWKETAVEAWQRVNEATGSLRSLRITGHEMLEEGVYCTSYEDGTQVIVNYNKQDVSYGGSIVKAQDFLVVKEG